MTEQDHYLSPPFWPVTPGSPAGTPEWSRQLTEALASAFLSVASRLEELNSTGGTGDFPDAGGLNGFYYDEDTAKLYFDNGTWIAVGGPSSVYAGDALAITEEPTGFPDSARTGTTLGYTKSTRTFALGLVSGAVTIYIKGVPISIALSKTLVLPATFGMHYVYVGTDGALASTTTWSTALLKDYAFCAAVYLADDGASGYEAIYIGDERHGVVMDWKTHQWLHLHERTKHTGGLALGDITASATPTGATDAQATMSVASGGIRDEDIAHTIATQSSPAQIPVFYRTGASGLWNRETATNAPVVLDTDRIYWNEWTGATWQRTEVSSDNYYALSHIFAANDPDQPIICIMGQAEYSSRRDARDGANTEINDLLLGDLPTEELLAIGTIIYKTNSGWSNTWHAAITTTEEGDDYINWLSEGLSPASAPSSHANLTNRDDEDQHPDSSINLSGTHAGLLVSATDLDDAMTVLDDLAGSDIDIDDEDVDVTGAYTGLLSGDTTLDAALDTVDAMSTEFATRQQVMNGSKTSITDNTETSLVSFTADTGPSGFAVGMTFVGQSEDSTDSALVFIQGMLMVSRNSSGTTTAEWVETANDDHTSGGSVTFGTSQITTSVASNIVSVKVTFDSSLNQSWTCKWTALMSHDVTVTVSL